MSNEQKKTKDAQISRHLLNPPRGTRVFFGQLLRQRRFAEEILRKVLKKEGFEEMITPTFEHEEVFTILRRAINEKLYRFQDLGGRNLVLRPEMNAPVCRTIGLQIYKGIFPKKLFYFVPLFRYERGQKGTFREFWQLGIEYFGADQPLGEAAIIHTLVECLDAFKIKGYFFKISNLSLIYRLLTTMGIPDRDIEDIAYKVRFAKSEKQVKRLLNDYGVSQNILEAFLKLRSRVLNISEAKILLKNLVKEVGNVNSEVEKTFSFFEVFRGLDLLEKVQVDFKLMRGTNHYNDAVFQIHHPSMQGDICGGGRYDKMVGIYSQNKFNLPAVGAAFGFDRIFSLINVDQGSNNKTALIIPLEKNIDYIYKIYNFFEKNAIETMIFPRFSDIKGALGFASKNNFLYIVFIGKKEIGTNTVSIRKKGEKNTTTIDQGQLKNFFNDKQ